MNRSEELANAVATAVLYEGYILYPYRPSSVKNQQRWNFGVAYPAGSSEGAAAIETQCLAVASSGGAFLELDVKVRFLHLLERTNEPNFGEPWQEGVEREILISACRVDELVTRPLHRKFAFPASQTTDGTVVRKQQAIQGSVELSAENAENGGVRIAIRLVNLSDQPKTNTRAGSLLTSLVSAHKILTIRGGEFISLIDPPEAWRQAAEGCKNTGTFPVLAGEEGQRNVMLSSPIILYDYPQIAPESAGDLCDGTEIDEILSLRILTLTDDEKREMRESDERGRRILERTESMAEEQWMKLHGVLRGLRPSSGGIQ